MVNALVSYKGKPARITGQTTHKFELLFEDGSSLRVREKDFRLIHPEFVTVNNTDTNAELSILNEFQGEVLTIKEITEWLFDEFNPQNAWSASLLVEDGMYAYWQKDKVFVRTTEQVDTIRAKREAEILEVKSLNSCTENIKNNTFQESDIEHIESIERVALNRSRHAKILSALEIDNTPEEAHRLLLKLGYYKQSFNPYPQRNKIPKDLLLDVKCNKVDRVDLTHLESYAIDNKGSTDADDAIGIEGDRLWVHIADVSSIVEDNSEMDLYAQERASNLYLPDQIIHMLPTSVTSTCALGLKETSDALSIGFCIKDEEVEDITIIRSTIRVKKISYDDADSIIDSDNNLSIINNIAMMHKEYRKKNGAIKLDLPNVDVRLHDENVSITPQKSSPSRELVAEMMVLAGRVVAIYAAENEIPMPYSVQGDGDFPKEILDNSDSLTLSESFGATKYFKRSSFSVNIKPHSGLGLSAYIRVTSPLRRYLDLLVHQQLSRFISNRDIISEKQIKEVIKKINSTLPNVNKAIRSSNEHYKCLYLLQNRNWQAEGVVVDTRGEKALVLVPSIGMIGQVKIKPPVSLDDSITVKASSVDICSLSVNFNKA